MAFKDVALAEMVSLFSPWVNDKAEKAAFLAVPETAGLHAQVERAYAGVVAAKPALVATSPDLTALYAEEDAVDTQHDHLARSVGFALDSHRSLCLGAAPPDVDRAQACEDAGARLFPDGMGFITSSYRAESGNAERAAKALKEHPEVGALLKSIPTKKGSTLLDTANLWLAAGAALGQLENLKDKLQAKLAASPAASKAVVASARNQWIRVANRIVDVLDDSDAPAEAVLAIRGKLRKAAAKAGSKAAGGATSPGAGGDAAPEPKTPPPTP